TLMEWLHRSKTANAAEELAGPLEYIVDAIRTELSKGTFVGLRRAREHLRSGQVIEWLHSLGVDVAPLLEPSDAALKSRVADALRKAANAHTNADAFCTYGARDGLSLVAALALDVLDGMVPNDRHTAAPQSTKPSDG